MEKCEIFINNLTCGKTEQIDASINPDFMDLKEKDLKFFSEILVKGTTYITEDRLIINLKIHTKASVPCSICNDFFQIPIKVENFYHTQDLKKITSHIYNFSKILREEVLLEVPIYVECDGKCSERGNLEKYFSQETNQFPFSDLN